MMIEVLKSKIHCARVTEVLSFDLPDDLKYWLPILSTTIGKEGNAAIAASVRERLGTDDPAKWVHVFLDEVQRMKQIED